MTSSPAVANATSGASSGTASWPPVPASLRSIAIAPGQPRYQGVRANYLRVGSPSLVVMAGDEDAVAATIGYAVEVWRATGHRVPLSFRSGGHGMSGSSVNDGGIVLDVSGLNRVQVIDAEHGLFRVQAGATWGDVAGVLRPLDLTITSGNFGDTGVGGLATSGGVGFFVRSQGLTIDRVRAARLVTADGRVRWVDAEREPDLFWAVRGGGSHVGIVTELVMEAEPMRSPDGDASVINQMANYVTTDLPGFVRTWGDWMAAAPREMVSFLMLHPVNDGRVSIQAINVWAGTDVAAATPVLEDGAKIGRLTNHRATIVSYPDMVPTPRARHTGQQQVRLRDVLVDEADEGVGEAFVESFAHRTTAMGELRSMGGAVADVGAEDTAWAGRHQQALVATWVRPHGVEAERESFAPLRALGTGAYGAYSSDTSRDAADLAWPGATGARLRRIAQDTDPLGLFDQGVHLRRGLGDF